ncbi:hypothetical protein AB4Y64_15500 [Lysobacter sp. TAF61]|uniref:hypothetical protein n=1 Tax=Lysobacter sp. TAF61 TaxID=3233072 RepID=UPI003F9C44F3
MKAITLAVAAMAAAGCLALTGCSKKAMAGPVECGKQTSATQPVMITVNPGPRVSQDECVVLPLTKLIWMNAKDNSTQFELKFRTANPGGQNQPLKVPSQLQGGSYTVNIDATQLAPGERERRYDYDVVVDGARMDPAIIIRKAN